MLFRSNTDTAAPEAVAPAVKSATRTKLSAAGRASIVASQRARWAKIKEAAQAEAPTDAPVVKAAKVAKAAKAPRRKMSPEGRARILAGVQARWARIKAARAN